MRAASPAVELRSFRGTRCSSVYRAYAVPGAAFRRIVEAAAADGLLLLGSFDPKRPIELNKSEARVLADEATRLRGTPHCCSSTTI
jgi:hypothetical protein